MAERVELDRSQGLWHLVLFGLAFTAPLVVLMTFGILDRASEGTAAGAYLLATAAIFLTALSYARMAGLHVGTGSAYTYVRRSVSPHAGFLVGWSILLDYLLLPMMTSLLAAVYLTASFPEIPKAVFVIAFLALTTAINILGIRVAARANGLLMLVQGLVLAAFFVLAIRYLVALHGAQTLETVTPFFRADVPMSLTAKGAALAALSFLGFDAVSTLSEEARNPERDVPRAIVLVAVIVGIIFVGAAFVAQLVDPDLVIKDAASAGLSVAGKIGGDIYATTFLVGMVLTQFAAGISIQASAARLLYAMGGDGVLPGRIFAYVNERTRTPVFNVVLSGAAGLLALVLSEEKGASLINFGAFVAFTSVNVSVIATWVRSRGSDTSRNPVTWLVLPLMGAAFTIWLLVSLESDAKIVGLVWISIGFVYLLWLTRGFRRPPPSLAQE